LILLTLGVATKVLWFRFPKVKYDRAGSKVDIKENAQGGATIFVRLKASIYNPNLYPLYVSVSRCVVQRKDGGQKSQSITCWMILLLMMMVVVSVFQINVTGPSPTST